MNNEEKILEILVAIQCDLTTVKQDVKALDHKVEEGFKATRSELVEAVETVGHKVDTLERTIKDVQNVTAQNAYDVQLMRRQA